MPRRVIGTAGHIDHGKTALVRAITGVDCDRLPEEKRRGITIDLGFANWSAGDLQIGFIDVPGHERFVRNMLAGVSGIDAALLVVAADESVKPQTREHFAICNLLRIPTGVVAITKSDVVDADILEIVRLEIEEMVRGSFLDGQPIVAVSSATGAGIEALKEALVRTVLSAPDRDSSTRVFRLPVDRVFTMKGFGTVVTGTTVSGVVDRESEVEVLPQGLRSRARNIQVHGQSRERATAGERTSVNLADLTRSDLRRGQQLAAPGILRPSQMVVVQLELLDDAPAMEDGTRVRFHHFSAELLGRLYLLGGNFAQIRLESPVVAVAGDRFVLRRYSPAATIGGGVIIDAHLGKLRKGTRPEFLESLADPSIQTRLRLTARGRGLHGVSLEDLQAQTGFLTAHIGRSIGPHPDLVEIGAGGGRWIHRTRIEEYRREAMDFVRAFFGDNRLAVGLPKGELIQKTMPPGIDNAVVDFLLRDLVDQQVIELSGDMVDVPGRSRELGGAEGDLARAIQSRFRDAGLQTPAVSEIIKAIPQKPKVIEGVIAFLVKRGTLVRLAEGIYVHSEVLSDARQALLPHSGESHDVAWFKEFYGISRKVVIPLLEQFDREGLTKRVGDLRLVTATRG
jgi:selenocysteine-specific elongation factor